MEITQLTLYLQICPCSAPRTLWQCQIIWQRDFEDITKVIDHNAGRFLSSAPARERRLKRRSGELDCGRDWTRLFWKAGCREPVGRMEMGSKSKGLPPHSCWQPARSWRSQSNLKELKLTNNLNGLGSRSVPGTSRKDAALLTLGLWPCPIRLSWATLLSDFWPTEPWDPQSVSFQPPINVWWLVTTVMGVGAIKNV